MTIQYRPQGIVPRVLPKGRLTWDDFYVNSVTKCRVNETDGYYFKNFMGFHSDEPNFLISCSDCGRSFTTVYRDTSCSADIVLW